MACHLTSGGATTFSQLELLVARVAAALVAAVEPMDRVAWLLPNCLEALAVTCACYRAAAVAVPINPRYTAPEAGMDTSPGLGWTAMLMPWWASVHHAVRIDIYTRHDVSAMQMAYNFEAVELPGDLHDHQGAGEDAVPIQQQVGAVAGPSPRAGGASGRATGTASQHLGGVPGSCGGGEPTARGRRAPGLDPLHLWHHGASQRRVAFARRRRAWAVSETLGLGEGSFLVKELLVSRNMGLGARPWGLSHCSLRCYVGLKLSNTHGAHYPQLL